VECLARCGVDVGGTNVEVFLPDEGPLSNPILWWWWCWLVLARSSRCCCWDEKLLRRPAHSQRRFTVAIGQRDQRRVAEHASGLPTSTSTFALHVFVESPASLKGAKVLIEKLTGKRIASIMGYTKLSNFMVTKSYPIFRQFQASAARDLLYLQAEIVYLESEYQKVSKSDRDTDEGDERHLYAFEWWHLSQSENRGLGGEQWALALEIRRKLREYCTSPNPYTCKTV
jgi:hypothetical protein